MIGLDTNVLVRYLTQDDAAQARLATALVEDLSVDNPGYVTQVALIEVVWVLAGAYRLGRADLARIIEVMLGTRELVIENAEVVWKALRLYAGTSADFADCLIERSAHAAQCEFTATFDVKAAKATGMRLLA